MIMPMLIVDDIEASMKFYIEKLDFKNGGTMEFADGRLMMGFVNLGSNSLMFGVSDEVKSPKGNGVEFYIGVDDDTDIDSYFAQVKSNGASVEGDIKTEFWGDRTFALKDLDGYKLLFFKTVKQVSLEEAQDIINTQPV